MKMSKAERIVAEAIGDIPTYGFPVMTEKHPFLRKVIAFMETRTKWMGTASELLWVLQDAYTPPNTAAKLLRKYSRELYRKNGIEVRFTRTSRKRIIRLKKDFNNHSDGSVYSNMTVSGRQ